MPTSPIKLVMSTLTYIVVKSQSQPGGRGGTSVGTAEPHCQYPQPRDCGSPFNFCVWSGGGGTAISFAVRLHGICNASHNRMEEGAHLGHLRYRPALGLGISAPPPCFRVLFEKVQQCSFLCDQTTGDLKSHHLQAGVTALSVPPPQIHPHIFFQQFMKKKMFF